jgi:hypothetical protein
MGARSYFNLALESARKPATTTRSPPRSATSHSSPQSTVVSPPPLITSREPSGIWPPRRRIGMVHLQTAILTLVPALPWFDYCP